MVSRRSCTAAIQPGGSATWRSALDQNRTASAPIESMSVSASTSAPGILTGRLTATVARPPIGARYTSETIALPPSASPSDQAARGSGVP